MILLWTGGAQHHREANTTGIVVGLLLIAAAIMRFAISAQGSGWNVRTTGVVLMIVGAHRRRFVNRLLGELGVGLGDTVATARLRKSARYNSRDRYPQPVGTVAKPFVWSDLRRRWYFST
jgi:hypothetical protein